MAGLGLIGKVGALGSASGSGKYVKVGRRSCRGNGDVKVREKVTYDGVKEEMSVMGVADADTARSGLLKCHGYGSVGDHTEPLESEVAVKVDEARDVEAQLWFCTKVQVRVRILGAGAGEEEVGNGERKGCGQGLS